MAIATTRYTRTDANIRSLNLPDSGLSLNGTPVSATAAQLNTAGSAVQAAELTFAETSGAGVWTGSVTVPAGASILDIIVNGVALWNSQTSATLKVGDVADDDGFYTAVDLKATDLLAGESISFALAGGKAGAYIANSQVSPRYSATDRVVSAIITKVGTTGTAGLTRVTVIWAVPASVTAGTKV